MSLKKHYRKVPPQLSDEELLSLTTQVLKKCGVENQTQAQFIYEICLEILQRSNIKSSFLLRSQMSPQRFQKYQQKSSTKSKMSSSTDNVNPFFSLQPRPKVRKHSIPWNQAYSLAISFLKEHGMHTTLAALEIEFKQSTDKNIVNMKSQNNNNNNNNNGDDEDDDVDYTKHLPGEDDTSFMENLTSSEYISYLCRINDSIYNITGNYSYLTHRGKQYQNRSNSSGSNLNPIPVTFKEKVDDFTRRQNLALMMKQNSSFTNSASEITLENGSFIRADDGNDLRYADLANRLKEMKRNYSQRKKEQSEIEVDMEFQNENENAIPTKRSFSNSSRTSKRQNKTSFSNSKK